MKRDYFNALLAFVAVVREGSFTRAAAQLGVSQSAMSRTIRSLENRLGVRLLTRTTRSISPTEAGEHLYNNIAGHLDNIDTEVQALSEFRDKPMGTVRITATDYVIRSMLWPRLKPLLRRYPDIQLELICDYGLSNLAEQRYDAGVRMGEQLAQDMIAVRISPDVRFAVVASPDYIAREGRPQNPDDLADHACINLRLPTQGGLYAWEFENSEGREVNVRVNGQVVFNSTYEMIDAALDGMGLAYIPEELVKDDIAAGRLVRVLDEWCPYWSGFHLYYPSRRQPSHAMRLVIDTLRHELPNG